MRDWYEKGWIHPDAGLTTFNDAEIRNAGKFFIEPQPLKGNNIKAVELVNASGNPDLQLKEIYAQPEDQHHDPLRRLHARHSHHVRDPVEAMKYINLMHSDSKLLNMMLFGVEGTHWEFEDDGRVNI